MRTSSVSSVLAFVVLSLAVALGGCAADAEESAQSEQQVSRAELTAVDLHPELPNVSAIGQRDLAEEARLDARFTTPKDDSVVDVGAKVVERK